MDKRITALHYSVPQAPHCYIPYSLKNTLNTIWHIRTTSDFTNKNLINLMSISGVVITYSLIKLQYVKWEQCTKRLNGILSSLKMTHWNQIPVSIPKEKATEEEW